MSKSPARTAVLPAEQQTRYQTFIQTILDELSPESAEERHLAQTIAETQWRLDRVLSIEEGLFAVGNYEGGIPYDDDPAINNIKMMASAFRHNSRAFLDLGLYEQRLQRTLERTRKRYTEVQTSGRAARKAAMTEAIRVRKLYEMEDEEFDPRENGLVFSNAEIAAEEERRERDDDARTAERVGFDLTEYRARFTRPDQNSEENDDSDSGNGRKAA
jgi:hypothetical protein